MFGQFRSKEMRYEFLPPILQSPNEVITLIIVIVSACFCLAIYGWVHAVTWRLPASSVLKHVFTIRIH